jgi:hypothetical protein
MTAPNLDADRVWSESQGGTRAAPTLATEGMPLGDVCGYVVSIYPVTGPGTTTFTGGTLLCWHRSEVTERWSRVPDLDKTITAGLTEQTWASDPVWVQKGREMYTTSGLTLSAGTNATVRMEPMIRSQL